MKDKLFDKLLPLYGLELRDKQVAELLNVSIATLYRIRKSKKIKYKKRMSANKNGSIVYSLMDVIDYICRDE